MMEAKGYPKFDAKGVKEHYRGLSRQRYIQQGRRDVVKWIEKEYGYFIDDGLAKIIIDDNGYYGRPDSIAKYQAQKKKWGIK